MTGTRSAFDRSRNQGIDLQPIAQQAQKAKLGLIGPAIGCHDIASKRVRGFP